MKGEGMDRHMLGLRLAAEELGKAPHPLFAFPGYQKLLHFQLSTSQVAAIEGNELTDWRRIEGPHAARGVDGLWALR